MKVRELIKRLLDEDPEDMVVVRGYEGGVNEVHGLSRLQIVVDYYARGPGYSGRHARLDELDPEEVPEHEAQAQPWAIELLGDARRGS